jgi:hypothetical protein
MLNSRSNNAKREIGWRFNNRGKWRLVLWHL